MYRCPFFQSITCNLLFSQAPSPIPHRSNLPQQQSATPCHESTGGTSAGENSLLVGAGDRAPQARFCSPLFQYILCSPQDGSGFKWTNGDSSKFREWDKHHPAIYNNCTGVGLTGLWYTENCEAKLPFVCEHPPGDIQNAFSGCDWTNLRLREKLVPWCA